VLFIKLCIIIRLGGLLLLRTFANRNWLATKWLLHLSRLFHVIVIKSIISLILLI